MNAVGVHNLFTCRLSMSGRCHVLLLLTEFSGVLLKYITLSRLTIFSLTQVTGRLTHTIVQGHCLFKVMGQKTCQWAKGKHAKLASILGPLRPKQSDGGLHSDLLQGETSVSSDLLHARGKLACLLIYSIAGGN